MWLASMLVDVVFRSHLLTIAHADRGRPTLKDDEQFRNGLTFFRDLKYMYAEHVTTSFPGPYLRSSHAPAPAPGAWRGAEIRPWVRG